MTSKLIVVHWYFDIFNWQGRLIQGTSYSKLGFSFYLYFRTCEILYLLSQQSISILRRNLFFLQVFNIDIFCFPFVHFNLKMVAFPTVSITVLTKPKWKKKIWSCFRYLNSIWINIHSVAFYKFILINYCNDHSKRSSDYRTDSISWQHWEW